MTITKTARRAEPTTKGTTSDASERGDWPQRAWIMVGMAGAAGLAIGLITDWTDLPERFPVWRQLAVTLLFVATIAAVVVVEQVRWRWAAAFAIGAALAMMGIGWSSLSYDPQSPNLFEWPFLAAAFATLIAAPLFQTARDEGAWRFPYAVLHRHAWTDAVIGAASVAFVGIGFLLAFLISQLLELIGLGFLERALEESWFNCTLAGAAFGGAAGLLRERDALLATLLRVVLVVFSVLAPVFAAGLALFLLALPFTGLEALWETDRATPILLTCAAGAMLLTNAVIGDGEDDARRTHVLRIAALILAFAILPLAAISAISMGQRISQYGWTTERLWGAVTVFVALCYGAVYLWSAVRGRLDFASVLRPWNTRLAIATCALAIVLAIPFVDFGAISARSQLARLERGVVTPERFDWAALRFDFGPAGRSAVQRLARSGDKQIAALAAAALKRDDRYTLEADRQAEASLQTLNARIRVIPQGMTLPDDLRRALARASVCSDQGNCAVLYDAARQEAAVIGIPCRDCAHQVQIMRKQGGVWINNGPRAVEIGTDERRRTANAIATGRLDVRPVERRQLFLDGKPVGDAFE